MKKTLCLVLVLAALLPCFAACNPTEDPTDHRHVFVHWKTTTPATCEADGEETATCSCGKFKSTEIDMLSHDYENGKCKVCNTVHDHAFTNNKCACGIIGFSTTNDSFGLSNMVEKASSFDGTKDGSNDKFYFSPTLAGKFSTTGAITIPSANYDKQASNNPTSNIKSYPNLPHYYITEKTNQTLVYKITVDEAGVYDMAIHMRLKDLKERGNKFTVNPDTAGAYSFETSFKPASDAEVATMKTTDGNDSTYMYGMQLYLNEGENIIRIEASTTEKCQHYRHFYIAKAS